MYEFKMPALGSEMTHGTLLEWKIKEGDNVNQHDIIALVDTDKAAIEVESFGEGIVRELITQPGEKVPVGTVMALIGSAGEEVPVITPDSSVEKIKISPRARKLAKDLNVDYSNIKGTGPEGSIVEEDIKKVGAVKPAATKDHATSMKKAIAAAMARSKKEIPHYYLSSDIDMSKAMTLIEKHNSEHPVTERILYAALLIKAVALALEKYPEFNGFYVDDAFQPSSDINVGFAISLRGGGLIAPAILNAQTLDIHQTMQALTDLVTRARSSNLRGRELSEPTITITNLGDFGVDSVFGVIYPPQVSLLGFGRITKEGKLTATLSADHRVSNGLSGSRFLNAIKELLEEPDSLFTKGE